MKGNSRFSSSLLHYTTGRRYSGQSRKSFMSDLRWAPAEFH